MGKPVLLFLSVGESVSVCNHSGKYRKEADSLFNCSATWPLTPFRQLMIIYFSRWPAIQEQEETSLSSRAFDHFHI